MCEIPPTLYSTSTQAPPAEQERALRARPLSAHPVPLLFLPEGTQGMSLFGIFRAKVTRPWEPSKGTCPMGHCAVVTFPAAFYPFRRPKARQKRRYSGKLPPRSLVWLPEGDLINARKKRKREQALIPSNKKTQGQGFVLKRKIKLWLKRK